MATKSLVELLAVILVILVIIGPLVSAADPIPAGSGTSALFLIISADARGSLLSGTELVFTQGTANLSDNPPLDPQGEGQATIGYDEKTLATSGGITYTRTIDLDTSSQGANGANLETVRQIDYANEGDGDRVGTMYSSESVMIEVDISEGEPGEPAGICPQSGSEGSCPSCSSDLFGHDPSGQMYIPDCGFSDDEEPCDEEPCDEEPCDDDDKDDSDTSDEIPSSSDGITPSSVRVIAGSEVQLKEGSVNSASSSRTVSDNPDAGIEVSYSVNVEGSGQTGHDKAEGKAEVYTDAIVMEGYGTNQTTEMSYEENVMVNGLVQISMKTEYTSP